MVTAGVDVLLTESHTRVRNEGLVFAVGEGMQAGEVMEAEGAEKLREEDEARRSKRAKPDDPPLVRPSDYLRSRCPLCFGGRYLDINHILKCVIVTFFLEAMFIVRS